ncbi:hypothetical protein KCP74_21330 [Salmonella enterica subsp. enterica]|nr:hypothetical protein KCP74_21330 [Salmonella enterica subsp. enterica]
MNWKTGPHQLVSVKPSACPGGECEERLLYFSAAGDSSAAQLISQVNFRAPRLENEREASRILTRGAARSGAFDRGATLPIPVKLDILAITSTAKVWSGL